MIFLISGPPGEKGEIGLLGPAGRDGEKGERGKRGKRVNDYFSYLLVNSLISLSFSNKHHRSRVG